MIKLVTYPSSAAGDFGRVTALAMDNLRLFEGIPYCRARSSDPWLDS
ncbi:hypothetical protein FB004_1445 [Sinorhizobium medicae]|nr:hypothetical protein [Sinorhizobium medicae]TWA12124.1 hypothetical protein FB006_1575 [Sinorhizobium medicae]TWA12182.1 hypothetical protein FB004_1445 [Sinorhizobium medicae]TWA22978.1 hypothetical protein FB007_15213 [Sinorhizobium medicae]TWA32915.1 hypothetical protein FB005_1555 [Sinorhizobium medicae]